MKGCRAPCRRNNSPIMAVLLAGHAAQQQRQYCRQWHEKAGARTQLRRACTGTKTATIGSSQTCTPIQMLASCSEREREACMIERELVGSQPLGYYWLETDDHPLFVYCSAAGHMQLDREEIIEQ
jgi:hypothetical protein